MFVCSKETFPVDEWQPFLRHRGRRGGGETSFFSRIYPELLRGFGFAFAKERRRCVNDIVRSSFVEAL